MIPHGVEVFVGLAPIDLRWGFDRLAGIVRERVGHDARSGALSLFFGRRRDALKIVFFDGSGMCLFYKRLDRGTFRKLDCHDPHATSLAVDERVLDDLLDGIDVKAAKPSCVGAVVDRFAQHCHTVDIDADSWRDTHALRRAGARKKKGL